MNKKRASWILLLLFIILGVSLSLGIDRLSLRANSLDSSISYDVVERSHYKIHTVTIPHDSNYAVVPVVSGELQSIQDFVNQDKGKVVAGINGGYFDPINHKTTSFIVEDSQIVADPRFNERLVDNPDLKQYLGKIFNRAEFRRYNCQNEVQYDIGLHSSPLLSNCTLNASLGGGPGLLPQNTSVAEAFIAYQDGKQIRDAIGSDSLNARSAVGITPSGDIILAMAAQKPEMPLNSGISLPELTDFLASLGAVKAMNLDGGSSAALFYGDRVIYGRVDREGKEIQRPIKSVLLVQEMK
ncbi:phosphodiester glycosidase family protein [Waterburya agarophytonicola K14]|uniref:Phosphodiester glycosidase family protein n=1 Tax=Waterburya agarophytonicola KI4 TaxID=2874699 RepID=A0A964BQH7_9CYAN|nr:phosphodiester glycosidase family protein [Waterburya agarophytonicola]MCC0176492.1 phosphodiester glycosidase family protein [Waterburya agarophytonicola KI4]